MFRKNYIQFIVVGLILIAAAGAFFYKPFKNGVASVVLGGLSKVGGSETTGLEDDFSVGASAEKEIMASEVAQLKLENKRLTEALGVVTLNPQMVPVRLMLERSRFYGDFYVYKTPGLEFYTGMYIYGKDSVVIGRVTEVFENYAKVNYLGQKDGFIAQIDTGDEFVELRSVGVGMYHGKLPGSSTAAPGSVITLKGFPKATVGTVTSIENSGTSLSDVYVRAPYNMSNVEIFYVQVER